MSCFGFSVYWPFVFVFVACGHQMVPSTRYHVLLPVPSEEERGKVPKFFSSGGSVYHGNLSQSHRLERDRERDVHSQWGGHSLLAKAGRSWDWLWVLVQSGLAP